MGEFLNLVSPSVAQHELLSRLDNLARRPQEIPTRDALGRVLADDIRALHPLPEFRRSTVDGYAMVARDGFGATTSLPAYLRVVGEVVMGTAPTFDIRSGECALIHTGGMLPESADAVVMIEHTQVVLSETDAVDGHGEIEIFKPVAPGENVILVGEDVKQGDVVIRQGALLRPQEIGGLMALGVTSVPVRPRPVVGLISTGDEIVDPDAAPLPGQVRDVNASGLAALVTAAGGEARFLGLVPDQPAQVESLARKGISDCDVVVITAGSSASARDYTSAVINSLGPPGVLIHGVNIRPGKPTILALCDGKAVLGLPGNPVSALVVARLFLIPVIERLLGIPSSGARPTVLAKLTVNLSSQAGREDWWPVRLTRQADAPGGWLADPIFGRSNLIFTLVSADGLIRIDAESNGLEAGDDVEVEPF